MEQQHGAHCRWRLSARDQLFRHAEDGLFLLHESSRSSAIGARRRRDQMAWRHQLRASPAFCKRLAGQHEIVPLLWTSGGAGGLVTADAFERIAGELIGRLSAAMPVDAVYLDLHGAMVGRTVRGRRRGTAAPRACDGRRAACPSSSASTIMPMSRREMVETTDSLVCLSHLSACRSRRDRRLCGAGALTLLLTRGRPQGRALRKLPFLIPLNDQCTLVEPSRRRRRAHDRRRRRRDQSLLSRRLSAVRPLLVRTGRDRARVDARGGGSRGRRHGARDRAAAKRNSPCRCSRPRTACARRCGSGQTAAKPIVLADTQDNPGCGSTADTTGVLETLIALDAQGAGGRLLLRCRCCEGGARRGRRKRHHDRARRPLGASGRQAVPTARSVSPSSATGR